MYLVRLLVSAILLAVLQARPAMAAEAPRYLLFQVFSGSPDAATGVFEGPRNSDDVRAVVQRIAAAVRPPEHAPGRLLGFSVGPISMDQGEAAVRMQIQELFQIAVETDMALALHLDDYMFWREARTREGRRLIDEPGNAEWRDWGGTPAENLSIGYLPTDRLPPQMCYESPAVRDFVRYWANEVIGQEVRRQLDWLERIGRPELFAGVIVGWESNLAYGYCSLAQLGYSAERPPADFDSAREWVLQRNVERWAKALYDAGIGRERIYTHIGPIPRKDYERIRRTQTLQQIREMHQSTAFRAFWTAFNDYSMPGFSAYPAAGRFADIYAAVDAHAGTGWAVAEGTNVRLAGGPFTGGAARSGMDWETFLGRAFNHGARLVNLFGGFHGRSHGKFSESTESAEAIAAYRKFLGGEALLEQAAEASSQAADNTGYRTEIEDFRDRVGTLQARVQAYLARGHDLQHVEPLLLAMDASMRSGDFEAAKRLLDQVDQILR